MKSRLVILAILFLSLTFVFINCSDNSVTTTGGVYTLDTASFVYPFKDGSTWNYTYKNSVINIRPDSIKHYFSDYPKYGNGITTILYDTMINGITTKCFLNSFTQDTGYFAGREYFANYDSGMVCYGYRIFGQGGLTPYKISSGIYFRYNEKDFSSTIELFEMAGRSTLTPYTENDTLILEDPPVVCLKYPVTTGTQWLFKNIFQLSDIYKKYICFEAVTVGTATHSCMKTERIWSNYSDMQLYDYYSKNGILKRNYTIKDVMVMDEWGKLLGYIDMNDLFQVTSFNIPSE